MPTVTLVTDIDVPPDAVWAVIADYSRGPEWQRNMTSARWTTPEPHGVGATFEQTAHFMGRDMTAAYEVTEHDAPRATAIRSTSGPFPITVRRVIEPYDGGTRVTETDTGGPGGAARLVSPLMKVMMSKTIARDYRRLKEMLEATPR
jgi:carbon monoxide dehydrogenase subunit G